MAKKKEKEQETGGFPLAGEHDFFFGHAAAEQNLLKIFGSARLHHAWLLEGIKGIGKATLAWRAARFLLAGAMGGKSLAIDRNHQAWQLTRAMSHPDFIFVSPSAEQKTETITINDIRAVNQFFTKSPALGHHRVCIIDAIDNMNVNATNGLLKSLEEPPSHAVFFLISHRMGFVPATIRSRCLRMKLKPLADADIAKLIVAFLPDASQKDIALAVQLGHGSAGRALSLMDVGGKKLYQELQEITCTLPTLDPASVQHFCSALNDVHDYDLFCLYMLDWAHQISKKTNYQKQGIYLWDQINMIMQTSQRFNMDHKQAAQSIFLALEEMAA